MSIVSDFVEQVTKTVLNEGLLTHTLFHLDPTKDERWWQTLNRKPNHLVV